MKEKTDKMVIFPIRMSESQREKLKVWAEKHRTSVQELFWAAVPHYQKIVDGELKREREKERRRNMR